MDGAHRKTDEKLAEMEAKLTDIYSRAKFEIGESWKEYMVEAGKEIEGLQREYTNAVKSGEQQRIKKAKKKLAQAKRERTIQNERFKALSDQVAVELLKVNETALAYINGELPDIYSLNYNAVESDVDGVGGYSFTLVDADTIRNLATKDESLLPYKYVDGKKDTAWNIRKINGEVLQGIIQGESMDKIATRLEKVIGMDEVSSIRNARTMVTGAECKGRQDSYERAEKDGIIMKKEWMETNDNRTRHTHRHKPEGVGGEIVGINETFSNGLLYPGDPSGPGYEIYNCRCSVAAKVIGFKKKVIDKTNEVKPDIARTAEEAKDFLTRKIGFKFVDKDTSAINNDILIKSVNRINELEKRFGVIHKSDMYFGSENGKTGTNAFVDSRTTNPTKGKLSLCRVVYSKNSDFISKMVEETVNKKWNMPCSKEYFCTYIPTHEYGHIIQNIVIKKDFEKYGWKENEARAFVNEDKNTEKARNKWYHKHRKETEKRCFEEIRDIAKENNPNFKMSENISDYGKSCYSEFFAECFANSQCGKPNELGKSMNIWLERNGFYDHR